MCQFTLYEMGITGYTGSRWNWKFLVFQIPVPIVVKPQTKDVKDAAVQMEKLDEEEEEKEKRYSSSIGNDFRRNKIPIGISYDHQEDLNCAFYNKSF